MKISLFRSTKKTEVFGFTADPAGNNLPKELGPWQMTGSGMAAQSYAESSLDGLALSDPVIKAVERKGFYLARSGLTITDTPKPARTCAPKRPRDPYQLAKMIVD